MRSAPHVEADRDSSTPSPRRARKSFTSPLKPLGWRAPAYDQLKPAPSPSSSRVDSAASTVPGRATAVTRLAKFTGLPNQSPARLTAEPDAMPARSRGKSLSPSVISTSLGTAPRHGAGPGRRHTPAAPLV